jgi:hypothetical protein
VGPGKGGQARIVPRLGRRGVLGGTRSGTQPGTVGWEVAWGGGPCGTRRTGEQGTTGPQGVQRIGVVLVGAPGGLGVVGPGEGEQARVVPGLGQGGSFVRRLGLE